MNLRPLWAVPALVVFLVIAAPFVAFIKAAEWLKEFEHD